MQFSKKQAKVNLSPVRVEPDLKSQVSAVSLQTGKNYTDTMTYLLESGIRAHLAANVAMSSQEDKPKPKAAIKRFIKPTHQDVALHMRDKGLDPSRSLTESEKFIDYYESNGWKVGKNAMKNWKAAASNWAKNSSSFSNSRGQVDQSGFPNNDSQIIDGHVIPSQQGFLSHES